MTATKELPQGVLQEIERLCNNWPAYSMYELESLALLAYRQGAIAGVRATKEGIAQGIGKRVKGEETCFDVFEAKCCLAIAACLPEQPLIDAVMKDGNS